MAQQPFGMILDVPGQGGRGHEPIHVFGRRMGQFCELAAEPVEFRVRVRTERETLSHDPGEQECGEHRERDALQVSVVNFGIGRHRFAPWLVADRPRDGGASRGNLNHRECSQSAQRESAPKVERQTS